MRKLFCYILVNMKIMITGCPASGKSTLAKRLSERHNISVFHLDQIFWTELKGIKQEPFIQAQQEIIDQNDSWIIDGDFTRSKSFELRVQNADIVIAYEFSKLVIYWRFLKRTWRDYGKSRPDMPSSRKETFGTAWQLAKFIWSYDTSLAWEKIEQFGKGAKVIILKSPADERDFLENELHVK